MNNVGNVVSAIIAEIKANKNKALFSYTAKLDNFKLNEENIKFSTLEIEEAYESSADNIKNALQKAYDRIKAYHLRQMPKDSSHKDSDGVVTGWKWYPLESVGIYVPGGLASYPSSVLMTATIAEVAGVKNINLTMPCPGGKYNKTVLAACKICGIENIYKVGGAQAIAALAYGTESISKVNKIVGPGNAYVAEAKKQVYGDVGIDSIAGPSEILIIADDSANPEYLAYDLLSQAEHDKLARPILLTDSKTLAANVEAHVAKILPKLKRQEIASFSWHNNKIIEIAKDKQEAVRIANNLAPEHMELVTNNNQYFVDNITTAGAIFIGPYSTESMGDYLAGPSHVLPTYGSAKFSSGLSIYDFLRRSSIIECNKQAFQNLADETIIIAEDEGLECHALACKIRR